jgi:hypothetical protein
MSAGLRGEFFYRGVHIAVKSAKGEFPDEGFLYENSIFAGSDSQYIPSFLFQEPEATGEVVST